MCKIHTDYMERNCRDCRLEYAVEYDSKNRDRKMLYRAKERAKNKNLAFNLELKDIIIPDKCPALGVEFTYDGGHKDTSPSLDRIIPKLGYIKGNIRVVSSLANKIMTNATPEQVALVAQYMKENG